MKAYMTLSCKVGSFNKVLDELIKMAKLEKYFDVAKQEFEDLKQKLAHDKNKDLQVFKNEISKLIKEEISSRFLYQKGRIEAMIEDDIGLEEAYGIINNPDEYKNILSYVSPPVNLKAQRE